MLLQVFHPAPPPGVITLFPNEAGGGVFFDNEETIAFTKCIGHLYVKLTEALGVALERELGLPDGTGIPIARRAVIPLAHCYTDRMLRLHRLLDQVHVDAIARSPAYPYPTQCEQFDSLATQSFAFNQDIAGRVGKLFGIPLANTIAMDPFEGQPTMPAIYANHLFFYAASSKLTRAWQRLQLAWSRLSGSVIATWMVNTKIPALEAGLYGNNGFAHMEDTWPFVESRNDQDLRRRVVYRTLIECAPLYIDFLASCGIEDVNLGQRAAEGLADFFADFYPSTLLEGAKANLDLGIRELNRYSHCSAVYSCGLAQTTQAAFLIAAARVIGKTVIGTQHGGHYGYMAAHTAGVDVEYPDCDEYVTWGWESFPQHPALTRPRIVTLPAPWYSHRKTQWRNLLTEHERIGTSKEFDFVFMPNKVYPFVPAPSAAHASINHVAKVSLLFKDVVANCTMRGHNVLMKLYGVSSLRLLASTLDEMQHLAGLRLRMSDNLDKGITPGLVRRCNVFLWDQPGTGFIECLHAQIPTLVYWPRLYNRETAEAIPIFDALESAALVHRTMHSLLDAYVDFRRDPKAWMAAPQRRAAAAHFLRTYGWAEEDWPRYWRTYLHAKKKT